MPNDNILRYCTSDFVPIGHEACHVPVDGGVYVIRSELESRFLDMAYDRGIVAIKVDIGRKAHLHMMGINVK